VLKRSIVVTPVQLYEFRPLGAEVPPAMFVAGSIEMP